MIRPILACPLRICPLRGSDILIPTNMMMKEYKLLVRSSKFDSWRKKKCCRWFAWSALTERETYTYPDPSPGTHTHTHTHTRTHRAIQRKENTVPEYDLTSLSIHSTKCTLLSVTLWGSKSCPATLAWKVLGGKPALKDTLKRTVVK